MRFLLEALAVAALFLVSCESLSSNEVLLAGNDGAFINGLLVSELEPYIGGLAPTVDLESLTPTILNGKVAVVVWSAGALTNRDTVGDMLTNYATGGGCVIEMASAFELAGNIGIGGTWQSNDVGVFEYGTTQFSENVGLGSVFVSDHGLMESITSFTATNPVQRVTPGTQFADAVLIATYNENLGGVPIPLVADKATGTNGRVVGINIAPGDLREVENNMGYQLLSNALHWCLDRKSEITHLRIVAQPPATSDSGTAFEYTIELRSDVGVATPRAGYIIEVSLDNNPTSAALGGTTQIKTDGVKTQYSFSTFVVEQGTGYALMVSHPLADEVVSDPFDIVAGPPTKLLFKNFPVVGSSYPVDQSFDVEVLVTDNGGNEIAPAQTADVTIELVQDALIGNAVLGGTTTLSIAAPASAGTFALTLETVRAGYQLKVSSANGNLNNATSNLFNMIPGSPANLVLTDSPPSEVRASEPFTMSLEIRDTFGNAAATDGVLSLQLQSNPTGTILQGNTSRLTTSATPIYTFTGLAIDTVSVGYTIKATWTGGGVTFDVVSSIINVLTGFPRKLVVNTPDDVLAGDPFAIRVVLQDNGGNPTSPVQPTLLRLTLAPLEPSFNGTNGLEYTIQTTEGAHTFTGLTITKVGIGYVITATLEGCCSTDTDPFIVESILVDDIYFTVQPTTVPINSNVPLMLTAATPFAITIDAVDRFRNLVTTQVGTINLGTSCPSQLSGNVTTTTGDWPHDVTHLLLNSVTSSCFLMANFTDAGGKIFSANSSTFTVTAGPPAMLNFSIQPANPTVAGSIFQVRVSPLDKGSNIASTGSSVLTLSLQPPAGSTASLSGVTVLQEVINGSFLFDFLSIVEARTGYTLMATLMFNGMELKATSHQFEVVAAAAQTIAFLSGPPVTLQTAEQFSAAIQIQDLYGNPKIAPGQRLRMTLLNGPSGASLNGVTTRPTSDTSPTVAFENLGVAVPFSAYQLQCEAIDAGWVPGTGTPFSVIAGPADNVKFVVQPPTTVYQNVPFTVSVGLADKGGTIVAYPAGGIVVLTLSGNPTQTSLLGTVTQAVGVGATTYNLTVAVGAIGQNYELTATLTGPNYFGISIPFNVRAQEELEPEPVPGGSGAGRTEDDGDDSALIAAVVLMCLVACVLIIGGILMCLHLKQKHKRARKEMDSGSNGLSPAASFVATLDASQRSRQGTYSQSASAPAKVPTSMATFAQAHNDWNQAMSTYGYTGQPQVSISMPKMVDEWPQAQPGGR